MKLSPEEGMRHEEDKSEFRSRKLKPAVYRRRYSRLYLSSVAYWLLPILLFAGCQQEMADQPRYDPLAKSDFFGDGRSARPAVEGTVARGMLNGDEQFYTGKVAGKPANAIPFAVTREVLARGRERYDIFCSPCHDRVGTGQGMIVRRGFRAPPSLHIDRLRQAAPGHFFDVATQGFGAMPDYAEQIPPGDRWAIVAYVRALQLSQRASLAELPEEERRKLLEIKP
jgi:cytochrome c5